MSDNRTAAQAAYTKYLQEPAKKAGDQRPFHLGFDAGYAAGSSDEREKVKELVEAGKHVYAVLDAIIMDAVPLPYGTLTAHAKLQAALAAMSEEEK